jgi:hypothetical protein
VRRTDYFSVDDKDRTLQIPLKQIDREEINNPSKNEAIIAQFFRCINNELKLSDDL